MAVESSTRCPQCGTSNPPQAQFCMQCGTLLQGTGAAERRVVTVLFADLVGSTRLTKQLDPEPMRTLIARFFAAMREEIARYGGTIEKFIGDAVMAVFGMPAAHEDDPERALRAALAMQRRMVSLNADLETDLHLRIAIATGEVVADLLAAAAGQFMVTGEVVNFAARLQTQAPPDGIVMDERTCEATRHAIAYEVLPLVESAEFGARPRFRVIGLTDKPPTRRLQAEMIGRDEEMQFLQALYRRVVEGRHPHLVTVIAAAGIGKTRLLHALRGFLYARVRSEPLVLVFEDLHWAEQSLLELLERLTARGGEAPMLILCLARPDLLERHPTWGMRGREHTALTLSPLSAAHSSRLITGALRGAVLPADVRDAVLARAEGNPFFLGEIISRLIDEGSLVHEGGKWKWVSQSLDIRIPDTIQALLLSRLDLLSPLEKRVIQDASVVGRTFWPGAISAIDSLAPGETAAALTRLTERDLVEERPASSLAGEPEFAFNHALIREVAYSTLPKAARSDHHRRLATWLQERAVDHGEEFLEILAHHREHAWRYRFETGERADDLARDAIDALRRAASRATALGTLPEARRLYERALTIVRSAGLHADATLYAELLTDHSDVVKWMSAPATVFASTETVLQLAEHIGRG